MQFDTKKVILINLSLSIIFIIFAFVYPIFNEKVFFSNKSQEAISISSQIAKIENLNYAKANQYMALAKSDTKNLSNNFQISKNDIKYYDYSIYTTYNTYTIYAEPKIEYLKNREISPKIYIYEKKLNQDSTSKWQ